MTSRRTFLKLSTSLAGVAALGGGGALPAGLSGADHAGGSRGSASLRRGDPRRILILGGTGFIGPHLVRTAVERGHTLTLFNRGRSEPELNQEFYRDVEARVGDRNDDLVSLETGEWDAVIDTSGYTPDQVRATAQLLQGRVDQYLFTSTRAVYTDFTAAVMDVNAPQGPRGIPESEWTGYGPLKVLAEREVQAAFPQGTSIVRPCIITGPGDTTDRFTYWYQRIHQGGQVLAPGDPSDPLQYIDVRDLVEFYITLLEDGTRGIFNGVAPAAPLTSAEFLYGIRATTPTPLDFDWVTWDFLAEHGLRAGQELPCWRPPEGEFLNYGRMDHGQAIAAGLTFRPLAETALDTRLWAESRGTPLRSGPSREKEQQVLAAWRETSHR